MKRKGKSTRIKIYPKRVEVRMTESQAARLQEISEINNITNSQQIRNWIDDEQL